MYYLYGKSVQNCNWYLVVQDDDYDAIVEYADSHPELNDNYLSFQIMETEIEGVDY
jgi:hypothetical protein